MPNDEEFGEEEAVDASDGAACDQDEVELQEEVSRRDSMGPTRATRQRTRIMLGLDIV